MSMLEWLCTHLMEAEVDQQLGAEKSQRTDGRSGYRSEAMLVQVVQKPLCKAFPLEKWRSWRIASALKIYPEARSSYGVLFQNLKDRGLSTPRLIISDAHAGLVSAIRESFPGALWQRCKVHFMRNILAYVPQKEKKSFAEVLKGIWLAPTAELARKRAYDVIDTYIKRFPKAVHCLEEGLEDSLAFYTFPMLAARKISSSNMIERLNREIRRRTSVVGIFPNESSYVRLVTTYLMEYAEDWSVSRAYLSQESIAATLLVAA